ncbi:MAG TPA: c-type cytochrome, partial [Chryseosolibacter sp.]
LRGRDLVSLPPVLVNALKPYQSKLTQQTLALAIRQGNSKATSQAVKIVGDANAPLSERLTYIRLFGEISEPACVPQLLAIVESNQSSAALRQDALQALQRYDQREIGQRVVKAYPDKLRADPGVRLAALSLFASRPLWAMDLLNAIDRKRQPGEDFIAHSINKEDVPDQIVMQLTALNDPDVSAIAARLWPAARTASGEEKARLFARASQALNGAAGNPDAGKSVFMNTCGSCHRLFDRGGTLGPDLSGYDRRNVSDLLSNIVDPGAYIREGYATYGITTVDGRTLSGIIEGKSGESLSLKLLSGDVITLPESEIREMRAQPSMMPERLLNNLSDQQICDLFAYLTKGS